jgi:23S rRNA (uracil1939-C5)-methyltransferase
MPKRIFKAGDKLTVEIERLAVGGRGVARHDGLVIFVQDAAPNEQIEIELTLVKKNFAEARMLQILRPSPHRIVPPCPVAGVCGGCSWQHIRYDEQLRQKREIVRDALRKFSGFDVSSEQSVETVVASPKQFRYRNRIQLHHSRGLLGFFKRGSHTIVDINDCLITEESLALRLPSLRHEFSPRAPGRFELYLQEDGRSSIRNTANSKTLLDHEEAMSPAFAQVNTPQNSQLIEAVVRTFVEELGVDYRGLVLDLYAGNGNFTFPLAESLPNATFASAELNPESVISARKRAQGSYAFRDFEIVQSDVGQFLNKRSFGREAAVLLDPPRTGCTPDVLQELVKKTPRLIAYVSCHPVTLARDLSRLKEANYQLRLVRPFDMFPQTDHIEVLAVLHHFPN